MPIYEYKCKNCSFEFELLIFSGEVPICPKCNSKNLDKKISLVSFSSKSENSSDVSGSLSSCSTCISKNCSNCR